MKLSKIIQPLTLDKSKKYLLACSCGPDSMALFGMLLEGKYNFEVAFVNYKTRTNSDEEQKILTDFCVKHNIKIYFYIVKNKITKNFEDEARKIRYEFFKNVAEQHKEELILLTAHQADDVIETFTMNEGKGKIAKYAGIAEFSEYKGLKIIHPLLCYEKKLLLEYCEKNKIPYSIDYTNFDDIHERNIVRKISETYSFEVKEKIIEKIDELNNYIFSIYSELNKVELHQAVKIEFFTKENQDIALRALFYLCEKFSKYPNNGAVLKDFYLNVIQNEKITNNIYGLENDMLLVKEYSTIRFLKSSDLESTLDLSLEEAHKKLGLNIEKAQEIGATKVVSISKFKSFKKNGQTLKTNRFFISCKMPISFRNLWPCLVNEKNEVVFVPRYNENYVQKDGQIFNFKIEKLF